MAGGLVLLLVGLTSLAATAWGIRRRRLSGRALGGAALHTLECIGLTLVFFAANTGLGVVLVAATRAASSRFVSFYLLDGLLLLLLSLLQAVTFARWWTGPGRE
jgi:hypothetical protein